MNIEYQSNISADARLAQGDILQWDKRDGSIFTELCIVVTADCDLFRDKNRGKISYVPVVGFDSYVRSVWGPAYVNQKVLSVLQVAVDAIQKAHLALGRSSKLSGRAIRDWLETDTPDAIASVYDSVLDQTSRKKLSASIANAQAALKCENDFGAPGESESDYAKKLAASAPILMPGGKASSKTIIDALKSHCSSLPGDVFFLNHLPDHERNGFFVLLRHISQCELADINLDQAKRPGPELQLRRVGRLNATFVYALTQQLARVFADIGLPEAHSQGQNEIVTDYLREKGFG